MPDRQPGIVELVVRDLDQIELPPRDRWRPQPRTESLLVKSGRSLIYASAAAVVLIFALIAGVGLRDGRVAQGPTPMPSVSPPAVASAVPATATPSPTAVTPGAITGELGYPGDAGLPPFAIYAISLNDPRVFFWVRTPRYTPEEWRERGPSGRATYTITGVTPGTYYVVGYVDSPDWPDLVAHWSRSAATCRGVSGTQCEEDNSLVPLTVRSGETLQHIHMWTWRPRTPDTPPRPR